MEDSLIGSSRPLCLTELHALSFRCIEHAASAFRIAKGTDAMARQVRKLTRHFPSRRIPFIDSFPLAFVVRLDFRHSARPVIIQRRIKMAVASRRGDVSIADCFRITAPFLVSTNPLSLERRSLDLVCSASSLLNMSATAGINLASLICHTAPTISHCVTWSTTLM